VRSVEKTFEGPMLDVRGDLIANALRSCGVGKQRGDATRNKGVSTLTRCWSNEKRELGLVAADIDARRFDVEVRCYRQFPNIR
jgi:hypothetical protein